MNDLEGVSILIVDDEDDLREILSDILSSRGAKITEASNGRDAFKLVQNNQFDLVLTDIRMANGDGMVLLDNIKSNDASNPSVVITSAYSDFTADELYHRGADSILSKPFSNNKLIESLKRLLLPLEQRYKHDSNLEYQHELNLNFNDLLQAIKDQDLNFGRNGFFVKLENSFPHTDDVIKFKLTFNHQQQFFQIEGCALCRWVRAIKPKVAGLEFLSFLDQSYLYLTQLMLLNNLIPSIPKYKHDD